MYQFILNMWIMGRCDEEYLQAVTDKKRITEKERDMILATPQLAM